MIPSLESIGVGGVCKDKFIHKDSFKRGGGDFEEKSWGIFIISLKIKHNQFNPILNDHRVLLKIISKCLAGTYKLKIKKNEYRQDIVKIFQNFKHI